MTHDELDRFIESPDGQRAIELSREFRTIMAKHNMTEGTVNGVGCNVHSLQSRLDSAERGWAAASQTAVKLESRLGEVTIERDSARRMRDEARKVLREIADSDDPNSALRTARKYFAVAEAAVETSRLKSEQPT